MGRPPKAPPSRKPGDPIKIQTVVTGDLADTVWAIMQAYGIEQAPASRILMTDGLEARKLRSAS